MKEPSCYVEMRRRKLFEIFEMIKGCSNVVYDAMNLKMNLILPNPDEVDNYEIDISDLLLAIYDHFMQEKNCVENMLIVECTDEQKEKIKKILEGEK